MRVRDTFVRYQRLVVRRSGRSTIAESAGRKQLSILPDHQPSIDAPARTSRVAPAASVAASPDGGVAKAERGTDIIFVHRLGLGSLILSADHGQPA